MTKINPLLLKNFRKSLGLSQKAMAKTIGINPRTYRSYESGSRGLTLEKFTDFKQALGFLKEPNQDLIQVHIDYLRMTFMSVRDLEAFCQNFLLCPLSEFREQETRLLSYTRVWKRGNIWLFDYFDRVATGNKQVTLQLSGQGCREMELLLVENQATWADFLSHLMTDFSDSHVTRLDIALDEKYLGPDREDEQFLLSDLITKVYQEEVSFKHIRSWNHIGGGQLNQAQDQENSQGISIYFGSRQSNLYFNFYEKRYELAKKEQISLEESLEIFGIWNRYELRFAQEKAQLAVEEYINGVDLAEVARGVINHEMQVYDGTNRYGQFKPDAKWQRLFGGTEPLKLSMQPKPYTIDRTVRWLMYQVSNSLKLVEEADKIMNTDYFKMIQESGEINDRAKAMLKDLKSNHKK
ncbi:replication initiation factor domain-containing protein [Streptococcus uberis]|uniref:replication initiation factor domain-containing protein n=1 Tax=Streptococcus uberis TaxID=1349 RepID=UPI0027DB410B|nr:replication initiation factor domain-containing protein [Streptococcus uberis]MCK1238894.1 replication initiation factor domain-containing protein [Streptococcus uberis]